jgi:hypothetical protein
VAPDVADVGNVVGVVHVNVGQKVARVGEGDGVEVDVCAAWAWRAVDLAAAAEDAGLGHERAHERLLVAGLRVADKGLPVGLSQLSAHVTGDARLGLCEEGAPALDHARTVERQYGLPQRGVARAALAEAQEQEGGAGFHIEPRSGVCVGFAWLQM